MSLSRHIALLVIYSILLGYGAILFWTKTDALQAVKAVQAREKIYFPVQISERMETQLVRALAKEKHGMMQALVQTKWKLLHTSFIHKVEKGKNGWLFLKEEIPGRPSALQSVGQYRYSPTALLHWELLIRQRAEWAAQLGMDYVLVIAPNKSTIYPEYLPNRYRFSAPTASDQLLDRIADLAIIDLRPCLRDAKPTGQLYEQNDTHWNANGAYAAYRCLMEQLPVPYAAEPLPLSRFTQSDSLKSSGDLARLLLMQDQAQEQVPVLILQQAQARIDEERTRPWPPYPQPQVYAHADDSLPSAHFDHDSFFRRLWGLLPEHFSESVFIWDWQGFACPIIEAHQPDLVVDEFVERSLIGDRPRNDWSLIQHYWQQHFSELDTLTRKKMPLSRVLPFLRTLRPPAAGMVVASIRFDSAPSEKLHLTYDDDHGWYTVPDWGITYYLEYEPVKIRKLALENKTVDPEVTIDIGLRYSDKDSK